MIERPVFIVAPPRSGAAALLRLAGRAPRRLHGRRGRHRVFDEIYELDPANRDWDSNRLTAADAEPRWSRSSAAT